MPNPAFRRTIVVGLGGAGRLILTNLKRHLVDAHGIVPPVIRLLALDTDAGSAFQEHGRPGLGPDEFIHLQVPDPARYIASSPTIQEWFALPAPTLSIVHGASAVRQNGRLAFFANLPMIASRLDTIMTSLVRQAAPSNMVEAQRLGAKTPFTLIDGEPQVYVCGSLAGGTGSGCFLDIGILLRSKLSEAFIQGFFLLSWLYRRMPWAFRVQPNAYAALTELEYFQSMELGSSRVPSYGIDYGMQLVTVEKPPYNLFHLVDGRKENGETLDSVDAVCSLVARAIDLSIGAMGVQVTSVFDNLRIHTSRPPQDDKWKGKQAFYSSLGLGSLYYPARELHVLLSASLAKDLCEDILKDLNERGAGTGEDDNEAKGRVDEVLTHVNINRITLKGKACPSSPDISLTPDSVDPHDLARQLADRDAELGLVFKNHFEFNAGPNVASIHKSILAELKCPGAPSLMTTAMIQCIGGIITRLEVWDRELANELKTANQEENDALEANARDMKSLREVQGFVSAVLRRRREGARIWAASANRLLEARAAVLALDSQRRFIEELLSSLRKSIPEDVVKVPEIIRLFERAQVLLDGKESEMSARISSLNDRSELWVVGRGHNVVYDNRVRERSLLRSEVAELRKSAEGKLGIRKLDDYVTKSGADHERLANLMLDACLEELEGIARTTIHEAIETLEKATNVDVDKQSLFDHLVRLAKPLWNPDKGMITPAEKPSHDCLLCIGLSRDMAWAKIKYDKYVRDACAKQDIRAEHSFSEISDPHRIWALAFSAAMPAHYLKELDAAKKTYEGEITPTYHIDRRLEMSVPDLFPDKRIDNVVLRVLAMAIVPGVDVIKDTKLPTGQGHEFSWDSDTIRKMNGGEPLVWVRSDTTGGGSYRAPTAFYQMYQDLTYNEPLHLLLAKELRGRITGINPDDLDSFISKHVKSLKDKLARREFSRLTSARLTYREIQALESFLRPDSSAGALRRRDTSLPGYGKNIVEYTDMGK